MAKVTYERGKTMTYPTMYPRLLVTPIFAHEGDFMWIDKIVCKYDTGTDIDEPEFSFRRDTVHSERNDKLVAENEKIRELARDLRFCARQSNCLKCEHGRFCDLRLDERCKELGIEVEE